MTKGEMFLLVSADQLFIGILSFQLLACVHGYQTYFSSTHDQCLVGETFLHR